MTSRWRTRFDEFMVLAGLVSPIATIPQVIKVFATHTEQASGQSLITWAVYTALAALWVLYGAMKRELPIVIGNGLGIIMYGLVTIGIMIQAGITF
jgi:MtN3 and saliva related transmembrane protein